MNDTKTETAPLTRDDMLALRKAERTTFHHYKGRSFIRVYLENRHSDEPRIFTAGEQRIFPGTDRSPERYREITAFALVSGYTNDGESTWGGMWGADDEHDASAYYYGFSYVDQVWRTIVRLMRAGDVIALRWLADNNNDNIRSVNFHADELNLLIRRENTEGMEFKIGRQVGPDNSARMIRRYGR